MLRYLDSGFSDDGQFAGNWLDAQFATGITAFRGQFGFYDGGAIRGFLPAIQAAVEDGGSFHLVLGSNPIEPPSDADIRMLLPVLAGRDPSQASLRIVRMMGRLFHPKVMHLQLADGRATALVGSSNFTRKGLGENAEAGIAIESGELTNGVLAEIAASIDRWRDFTDPGSRSVMSEADITTLLTEGFIASDRDRRRARGRVRAMTPASGAAGVRGRVGWRPPPATTGGDDPGVEIETAGDETLADHEESPAVEFGAVTERWCKLLRSSDAQQVGPNTNPTGKLRLAQARFNISHGTYFREIFFGDQAWTAVDRRGVEYEEVHVDFIVRIHDQEETHERLRVDHAPHREADQANVPTVLGWGPRLGAWLRANSEVGNWVLIERDAQGLFRLTITSERPEWAP